MLKPKNVAIVVVVLLLVVGLGMLVTLGKKTKREKIAKNAATQVIGADGTPITGVAPATNGATTESTPKAAVPTPAVGTGPTVAPPEAAAPNAPEKIFP